MTHRVEWTFDQHGVDVKVKCSFDEGSPCRMTCRACGGLDQECCDFHTLEPYDTCKIAEWAECEDWIDHYVGIPAKPVDGPIEIEWASGGEYPTWRYDSRVVIAHGFRLGS